jgi:formamidopyrimidine-DNA glycosylase
MRTSRCLDGDALSMPELPEVETARRGIAPALTGRKVAALVVRERRLRQPLSRRLDRELPGQTIEAVERRAKYLLLRTRAGTVILHLGMSGSLRLVPASAVPDRHDHFDIVLEDGIALRYRDPRRFGLAVWTTADPLRHALLNGIGPEPFSDAFSVVWLHARARGRKTAIKPFLMDSATVAGVGNIYANEALWIAGVHPLRHAGRISALRCEWIVAAVRQVLGDAIRQGGTTLRDFHDEQGRKGWFEPQLKVYGRDGQPCPGCGAAIRSIRQAQRATWYCPACQR